ncbi:hypothetical protein GCM10010277_09290 [Streptomyces longisporoflavus]|uniref:hypothetical protein n=1 Tax=Streptomyces longisporoflavus TaxID=28044 RepID=UPI00167DB6E3|nr:hypothetical protein [Streptomyces longisporoflavus]GGV27626.1 hypothetical protein GCM10010277_09290 [Streptomyces longisporoflavus]
MRLRTALTATALAAFAVLGASGVAAADDDHAVVVNESGSAVSAGSTHVEHDVDTMTSFGDLVLD